MSKVIPTVQTARVTAAVAYAAANASGPRTYNPTLLRPGWMATGGFSDLTAVDRVAFRTSMAKQYPHVPYARAG